MGQPPYSDSHTSIDPKQFQNDSLGPILYSQKRFLGTPYLPPQEQIALSRIFVGIDIANCSAIREDKRRAGQEEDKTRSQSRATELKVAKTRPRGGQDPDTEPGHRAQPQSSWARPREGQEEDTRRTRGGQDLDTEPGHRAWPQSSGARPREEFMGAAKRRTRGAQEEDEDTEPGHRVQGRGQDKGRTRPGHRAGPQSQAA